LQQALCGVGCLRAAPSVAHGEAAQLYLPVLPPSSPFVVEPHSRLALRADFFRLLVARPSSCPLSASQTSVPAKFLKNARWLQIPAGWIEQAPQCGAPAASPGYTGREKLLRLSCARESMGLMCRLSPHPNASTEGSSTGRTTRFGRSEMAH